VAAVVTVVEAPTPVVLQVQQPVEQPPLIVSHAELEQTLTQHTESVVADETHTTITSTTVTTTTNTEITEIDHPAESTEAVQTAKQQAPIGRPAKYANQNPRWRAKKAREDHTPTAQEQPLVTESVPAVENVPSPAKSEPVVEAEPDIFEQEAVILPDNLVSHSTHKFSFGFTNPTHLLHNLFKLKPPHTMLLENLNKSSAGKRPSSLSKASFILSLSLPIQDLKILPLLPKAPLCKSLRLCLTRELVLTMAVTTLADASTTTHSTDLPNTTTTTSTKAPATNCKEAPPLEDTTILFLSTWDKTSSELKLQLQLDLPSPSPLEDLLLAIMISLTVNRALLVDPLHSTALVHHARNNLVAT